MPTFHFEAIGTHWQIDIIDDRTHITYDHLFATIQERIEVFDRTYSRFRTDSLVSRMSQQRGTYPLPDDAQPLMDLYARLYRLTAGAFTPLIGNVLEDAGYDAHYSLRSKGVLERPPAWDDAMEYRFPALTMKRPAILDFGAAGKGYLIDTVGHLLEENGILAYSIDAGGDILKRGGAPLRVGLEHPDDATQVIGVTTLSRGSICCSAGNRRKWGDFHHIIDPHTLVSPRTIVSTWVKANTAMVADALATCLFLSEPKLLLPHFSFEYAILYQDHSLISSPGFDAEFFIAAP